MFGLYDTSIKVSGGILHSRYGFIPNLPSLKRATDAKVPSLNADKHAAYHRRHAPRFDRNKRS